MDAVQVPLRVQTPWCKSEGNPESSSLGTASRQSFDGVSATLIYLNRSQLIAHSSFPTGSFVITLKYQTLLQTVSWTNTMGGATIQLTVVVIEVRLNRLFGKLTV